jgi:hypothetical protein
LTEVLIDLGLGSEFIGFISRVSVVRSHPPLMATREKAKGSLSLVGRRRAVS